MTTSMHQQGTRTAPPPQEEKMGCSREDGLHRISTEEEEQQQQYEREQRIDAECATDGMGGEVVINGKLKIEEGHSSNSSSSSSAVTSSQEYDKEEDRHHHHHHQQQEEEEEEEDTSSTNRRPSDPERSPHTPPLSIQIGRSLRVDGRQHRSMSSPTQFPVGLQRKMHRNPASSGVHSDPGDTQESPIPSPTPSTIMSLSAAEDSGENAVLQLKQRLNQMYRRFKAEQELRKQSDTARDQLSQSILDMEEKVIGKLEFMEKSVMRYRSKIRKQSSTIQQQRLKMLSMFVYHRQQQPLLQKCFHHWRLYVRSIRERERTHALSKAFTGLRIMAGNSIMTAAIRESKKHRVFALKHMMERHEHDRTLFAAKLFLLQLFREYAQKRATRPTTLDDLREACSTVNNSTIQQVLLNEREKQKKQFAILHSHNTSHHDHHHNLQQHQDSAVSLYYSNFEKQLFARLQVLDEEYGRLLGNRKVHMTQQQIVRKTMRALQPESTQELHISDVVMDEQEVIRQLQDEIARKDASIEALKHITEEQKQVIYQVKQVSKERFEQAQQQHSMHNLLIEQLSEREKDLTQLAESRERELEKLREVAARLRDELSKEKKQASRERAQIKDQHEKHEESLKKWREACLRRDEEILEHQSEIDRLSRENKELKEMLSTSDRTEEHPQPHLTLGDRNMLESIEKKDRLLQQCRADLEQQRQETAKWKALVERYEKTLFSTNTAPMTPLQQRRVPVILDPPTPRRSAGPSTPRSMGPPAPVERHSREMN